MKRSIVVALLILFTATTVVAGPLDDLFGEMSGLRNVAWWVELVSVISAVIAFSMAILPQGTPGGRWDRVRTFLNYLASNWGNAKNLVQPPK